MTNWIAIKAEYICGHGSYRSICAKYGLTLSNLSRKASKEHWPELREEFQQKQLADMEEFIKEKNSAQIAEICNATANIIGALNKAISEIGITAVPQKTSKKEYYYDEEGKIKSEETTETTNLVVEQTTISASQLRQLSSTAQGLAKMLYPLSSLKDNLENPTEEIKVVFEGGESFIEE